MHPPFPAYIIILANSQIRPQPAFINIFHWVASLLWQKCIISTILLGHWSHFGRSIGELFPGREMYHSTTVSSIDKLSLIFPITSALPILSIRMMICPESQTISPLITSRPSVSRTIYPYHLPDVWSLWINNHTFRSLTSVQNCKTCQPTFEHWEDQWNTTGEIGIRPSVHII